MTDTMPTVDAPPSESDKPTWSLLFRLQIDCDYGNASQVTGTPAGTQSLYPITGGQFHGDELSGTVQPGGADFPMWRSDGCMLVNARIVLKTNDGELIAMTYEGITYVNQDDIDTIQNYDRKNAGETAAVYGRTTPRFETGSEKYAWLNRTIAVAKGHRTDKGPLYTVYGMDIDVSKGKGQS